jgi:hypothetical protein
MGERKGSCRILVRRPEGKRPLESPKSKCYDKIKIYFQEVGWGFMDWLDVAQDM